MPLPWPALVFAGSASVLLTLLARAALLRAPLRADSQHRAASSLASVGVLACASLLGRHGLAYGCATLFGHMLADLASCALLGPATSPLMLAHHAVTMFLTGQGLVQLHRDAPALRAMLANAASVLLWMEATNPFLHACTLVGAEAAGDNARGVMVSDDVRCLMRLSSFSANWLAAFDVVDGAQVLTLLALLAPKYND